MIFFFFFFETVWNKFLNDMKDTHMQRDVCLQIILNHRYVSNYKSFFNKYFLSLSYIRMVSVVQMIFYGKL